MRKYSYTIKVQVRHIQEGNLYWAYDWNDICVTPPEGRRTEPDAKVDARLNFRQAAKYSVTPLYWLGIDPVLQEKKD